MNQTDPSFNDGSRCMWRITGYHKDDEGHWVAQLACGHNQHVRHEPPWMNRPWVTTASGRDSMLGYQLACKKCEEGAPVDERPAS